MLGQQAQQLHLPTGQVLSLGTVPVPVPDAAFSRSGRYLVWGTSGIADFAYGSVVPAPWDNVATGGGPSFAGDSQLAYTLAPTSYQQAYIAPLAWLLDGDADGLNDHWERAFGSSITPGSGATGDDGADGDPDTDGLTNAQEFARGSHPRGTLARYLAEGASGTFFSTRYAIANPRRSSATTGRPLRVETDGGAVISRRSDPCRRGRAPRSSRARWASARRRSQRWWRVRPRRWPSIA